MTPIRNGIILRNRVSSLEKRKRRLKRLRHGRHLKWRGLHLSQRLQLDIQMQKEQRAKKRIEKKKKRVARRETAKLNRTLKRRRRR